ncbi:LysR family transcriptional regulator [Marinobacterium jannaschii]|uniref:LysR family transcriptional regulator n=1 Tax=Marinobacterium jannaschii TaxID=64970 RepID=UPI0006858814|nr:LysR family transcriptional regulator [Marinobacterium jannaschii]
MALDKWTEMQVFIEAAKCQGFSAAGRQLDLSPSAVSKLVSRLESRLAVRLFNRTTRTLSLTEAGRVFYNRCVIILADLEDAEACLTDFGQVPQGLLRINSTPGFAKHQLMPRMPEFQARYPQLEIDYQLTGQAVDLIAEGVDLAIRLGPLQDTSLVARKLGESQRLVCASPAYLEQHGIPQTPAELAQHNCLRLSTSERFNQWQFTGSNGPEQVDATGSFISDNVDALHQFALIGGGIARLSGFMIGRDIEAGRLVALLPDYEIAPQQIHAVYPHRKHLPAKTRALVEFLLEGFTPIAPWR